MKIWNPIKYYQDKPLLTFNLIVFSVGTIAAVLNNVIFDGIFDLHFWPTSIPIKSFASNVVNVLIITLTLMTVGRIINPKTRLIDCLNSAFLSRIPYYLVSLLNIGGYMSSFTSSLMESIGKGNLDFQSDQYLLLGVISIFTIIALMFKLILLYNGFKVSVNPKQTKHYVYFFIGLLIAEIISSIILKNI